MQKSFLGTFISGLLAIVAFFTGLAISNNGIDKQTATVPNADSVEQAEGKTRLIFKDVGEAYMDYFGLTDADFKIISAAGFDTIEGNFDICASDEDVSFFLNEAQKYNLEVIMPAGAGEAEWGYVCDEEPSDTQKPVWQDKLVSDWINKWRGYENIYAWDTSNEAGSVMPNSEKGYYLSASQLQQAYKTVKANDPDRPVMIRMNGWFFYDYETNFFREGNPFAENAADVVMVNAYSNVEDYYDDFVNTVATRAKDSITEIDPKTGLIISLGTWEEKPLWFKPSIEQMKNDYDSALELLPSGIAFFKYGAKGSEWYLPDNTSLWQDINSLIKNATS